MLASFMPTLGPAPGPGPGRAQGPWTHPSRANIQGRPHGCCGCCDLLGSCWTQRMGINHIEPSSFDRGLIKVQLDLARAEGAGLIVVFVHWGPNWQWLPSG